MNDIKIEGDVNAGNANFGNQYFYGDVYITDASGNINLRRKPRVFLSYTRSDDDPEYDTPEKSLVRRMYDRLSDDFVVWWDRETLPSRGETFTAEIERAICAAERFVLIVGPGAAASPYVRKEWEFAQSLCLPITVVL